MSGTHWKLIEDWLAQHATKIVSNLNPPATAENIAQAAAKLGLDEFPESLRTLYQRHNGMNSDDNMGCLFFGMHFLTLQEILVQHALTDGEGERFPVRIADEGIDKADMLNPKWIPFAHDHGQCTLCVDLSPAPSGTAGQVIFTDQAQDTVILVASSVSDMLASFVDDLNAEKYFLNEEALEDGNHFLGCSPEIDIINWAFSPRWRHLSDR